MPVNIEALTTASLSLALDAATVRQQVIAANIANANVEGYAAQRVSFDAALMRAFDAQGGVTARLDAHVEAALTADGRPLPVQIDAEMAAMSQNQLQYQALVKGLNHHYGLLELAAADGKR